MNGWEIVLALCLGLGLSAACGFRIFVPLLIISIASHSVHLQLAPGFAWIGSGPAMIAFAVATILEIVAYYVPWLDNLLDSIATPAATVAGIIVTAACVSNMSPFLRWSIAVIAGGGVALAVQTTSVLVRGASTATTGGVANPLVSTVEAGASLVLSVVAIVIPILAAVLIAASAWFIIRTIWRRRQRRRARAQGRTPAAHA